MNRSDQTSSYVADAWSDFCRQRLAVASLMVVAVVLLLAILCPLLANNRPLVWYGPIGAEYRDAVAIAAEQVAAASPDAGPRIERAFAVMREHLGGEAASALADIEAAWRSGAEPTAISARLEGLFEAPTEPVLRFPAFRVLNRAEIAAFLMLPIALLAFPLRRRLGWAGIALLAIVLAIVLATAIRVVYTPVKDSRNYRRMIHQVDFAERGFALLPPIHYGENENIMSDARSAPTWLLRPEDRPSANWHWLGTDTNGRDVLARMIYGARISVLVGVLSVGLYTLIGMILGSLAGFYRGWTDMAISRLLEFVLCFPVLMVILSVQAFLAPSLWNLIIALALLWWTGVARLQRAEFLRLVDAEFVQAVRALGGSDLRIMVFHLLPNSLAPILVIVSFGIAGSIVVESALSFLGFGVPQPMASWGDLLNNGRNDVRGLWWLTIFPGMAIFITVTCFNLVGEALRDVLDPRRARGIEFKGK